MSTPVRSDEHDSTRPGQDAAAEAAFANALKATAAHERDHVVDRADFVVPFVHLGGLDGGADPLVDGFWAAAARSGAPTFDREEAGSISQTAEHMQARTLASFVNGDGLLPLAAPLNDSETDIAVARLEGLGVEWRWPTSEPAQTNVLEEPALARAPESADAVTQDLASAADVTAQAQTAPHDKLEVAEDVAENADAGTSNGAVAIGNVLHNDRENEFGDQTLVVGIAHQTGPAGEIGQSLRGAYGALTILSDGAFFYEADLNNPNVQALASASETLTDIFHYQITDHDGLTSSARLTIELVGANDAIIATTTTGPLLAKEATVLGPSIATPQTMDEDQNDTISFASCGDRAETSSMPAGDITVRDGPVFNYVGEQVFTLSVHAMECDGRTFNQSLTVAIQDVHAPLIPPETSTLTEGGSVMNTVPTPDTRADYDISFSDGVYTFVYEADGLDSMHRYSGSEIFAFADQAIIVAAPSDVINPAVQPPQPEPAPEPEIVPLFLLTDNGANTALGPDMNDRLEERDGQFALIGGGGDDVFLYGAAETEVDLLDGGERFDTIIALAESVTLNLSFGGFATGANAPVEAISGDGFNDAPIQLDAFQQLDLSGVSVVGIEANFGDSDDEARAGSAREDRLFGQSGNDVVTGERSGDACTDGEDSDTLSSGDCADQATGAKGHTAETELHLAPDELTIAAEGDHPNDGDTITYALDHDADGRFAVDPRDGAIRVTGVLDCASAQSHSITIRITDQTGLSLTRNAIIQISDTSGDFVGTEQAETLSGSAANDILSSPEGTGSAAAGHGAEYNARSWIFDPGMGEHSDAEWDGLSLTFTTPTDAALLTFAHLGNAAYTQVQVTARLCGAIVSMAADNLSGDQATLSVDFGPAVKFDELIVEALSYDPVTQAEIAGPLFNAQYALDHVRVGGTDLRAPGDTLHGSLADNTLTGSPAWDEMLSGADEDTIIATPCADANDAGAGDDTLELSQCATAVSITLADIGADNEAQFGDAPETQTADRHAIADQPIAIVEGIICSEASAAADDDVFDTREDPAGDDAAARDRGDDHLLSGRAEDVLSGGLDGDTFITTAGADADEAGVEFGSVDFSNSSCRIHAAHDTMDQARLSFLGHDAAGLFGSDSACVCDTFTDIEQIIGSSGVDWIDLGAGDDTAFSGLGEDFLIGGDGDDTLFGSDDADLFVSPLDEVALGQMRGDAGSWIDILELDSGDSALTNGDDWMIECASGAITSAGADHLILEQEATSLFTQTQTGDAIQFDSLEMIKWG